MSNRQLSIKGCVLIPFVVVFKLPYFIFIIIIVEGRIRLIKADTFVNACELDAKIFGQMRGQISTIGTLPTSP